MAIPTQFLSWLSHSIGSSEFGDVQGLVGIAGGWLKADAGFVRRCRPCDDHPSHGLDTPPVGRGLTRSRPICADRVREFMQAMIEAELGQRALPALRGRCIANAPIGLTRPLTSLQYRCPTGDRAPANSHHIPDSAQVLHGQCKANFQ
jgi:hypothetical protein